MDRLAAERAKRKAQGPGPVTNSHEMTTIQPNESMDIDSMPGFYSEISSIQDAIQQYNRNVQRISDLQSQSISALPTDSGKESLEAQLNSLQGETQVLSTQLKNRIKQLTDVDMSKFSQRDRNIRRDQTAMVRSKFIEAIQQYQRVEQDYQSKSKQRVERQIRIVKPNATPEEIQQVIDGGNQDQIFMDATLSQRYGGSRAAYREVQIRQEELKKMERTIAELAQMFNDMAYLVEQQEAVFNSIETKVADVEANTRTGLQHTEKAVVSARNARRLRWVMCMIITVIVIVIALVLGLHFGLPSSNHHSSNSNSSNSTA